MRIGLLGTGPWAELAYAPALRGHADVDFTGVWGRRPEAAGALAERFGTRPYDDVDALIADTDAIAIALPPAVQAPLAVRAARAGRHLLLDKPLAIDVAGARAVVAAVRETGVASAVFFTARFADGPRQWIAEQSRRGGWFTAHAAWIGALDGGPFADSPWRREKGALWDVGPHALSVLLPVLGDVHRVAAATTGPGDTVHLVLRHDGGASSTATLTLTAPGAATGSTAELRGDHGVTAMPASEDTPVTALDRMIGTLLDAARTGRGHDCDAAFGLRVVEILAEAARRLSPDASEGDRPAERDAS
ncbi:Gfo/Idh/MocA family oxidoreductase [Actinoallomurus spadix]|uniref:Gfo/Idh/MocA family protein n=1 Tax=Actinoallomurus spadix TaxID=79912 RepID=UPI002093135A|nr:Gfo/Idh/MocA family oxidoreductase [Actinoallomurus spadix]MCO5984763.1 Gfo/Idh/MocA family oxidoreductase [Actinoallomurus spadix]